MVAASLLSWPLAHAPATPTADIGSDTEVSLEYPGKVDARKFLETGTGALGAHGPACRSTIPFTAQADSKAALAASDRLSTCEKKTHFFPKIPPHEFTRHYPMPSSSPTGHSTLSWTHRQFDHAALIRVFRVAADWTHLRQRNGSPSNNRGRQTR